LQYICIVTLNRIKQILLLAIALYSISLAVFFSVGLFHAHKLATSSNIVTNETEKLIVSSTEFSSLPKNILNNNVFEIEYQGEEYDVYKTELVKSKSQVVLWLIKDGFENKLRKLNSIIFNTNAINNRTSTNHFLVFNFYFFEEVDEIKFSINSHYSSSSFYFLEINSNNILDKNSPPPKC